MESRYSVTNTGSPHFETTLSTTRSSSNSIRSVLLRRLGLWGQVEQFPVAGVFEKFIQIPEQEFSGLGVLIDALEHHSTDEYLAPGV